MYLIENKEFFYRHSSNLDAGVEGLVLLNNGFYHSFTLFDSYTDWKDIEVLEDQYSIEQIEALEKELLYTYKKNRIPVIDVKVSKSLFPYKIKTA